MAISGTGTGPFTITGTETTLAIYNFVVAANAANATKNAANTQFTFLCTLNVGDGTTATTWASTEQQIEITAGNFNIRVNATVQLGTPTGARAGCYFRVNCPADAYLIQGTLLAYASRVYSAGRVRATTGAVAYHEDCNCNYLDGIDNNFGATNPTVSFVRGTVAGATAVGVKLGGAMVVQGTRVSNATYAFQPMLTNSGAATYTLQNYIGINNANDAVPNAIGTTVLNIVGAFDGSGTPRTSLILNSPNAGATVRLRWLYDLLCTSGGAAAVNTNVRIRNTNLVDVFTGVTNASGSITQQTITRVEYIGRTTGTVRFPYNVKARRYDLSSEELTWQCDNHTADKFVQIPYTMALTQVQAAALTDISLTQQTETIVQNALVNSDFATDTVWTKGTGVTISGGVANINNSGAMLSQNCTLLIGETYTVTLNYTKTSGASLRVSSGLVDGTNIINTSAVLPNGSGTYTFTFVAARDGLALGASGATFTGTIDNFTCTRSYTAVIANTGNFSVNGSRTVVELWCYWRNWISTITYFDNNDSWTLDGTALNTGAWPTAITTGTVSGGTIVSPSFAISAPAIVSANLSGTVVNAGTVSGVIVGNVTNTGTLASGANITGNVTQATPTSLTGVTITGNLTFNTNTPITVTFTNTTVTGTVSNSGTGLVTILLANSTVGTVGSNVATQLVTALSITSLLADSQIYVSDNTGTQVAYVSSSGTSYNLDTTGGTGTWEWRVRKYGYEDQSGTFTPATSSESVVAVYLVDAFVVDTLVNVTAYTDLQTAQKIYDYSRYFATTNTGIALAAQFDKGFGTLTANSAFTLNPSAGALMAVAGGVVTTLTSGLAETVTVVVTGNFTQGAATLSNNVKIRATNLDSELLFSGIDSLTVYATQSDALNNTSPGATSTTGIIRFLYGAALSGVTMSGTVYLRLTLGTAIQVQSLVLVLGENEVNLSTTTLLQSINTKVDNVPTEVLAATVETNTSLAESLRLANSVLGGKVSGASTSTETFRDINDTKNRVVADVDSNGNRTAITLDLS